MTENFRLKGNPDPDRKGRGRKRNRIPPMMGYCWPCEAPAGVVCVIHGIGEYAGRYRRLAARMREEGLAVLSADLPGHGGTPGVRGHCAPRRQILEAVDALILEAQRRFPDAPVILYGHSLGGNIVLDYRQRGDLRRKAAACVASAPWLLLARGVSAPLYLFVRTMAGIKPDFLLKASIVPEDLGNPEVLREERGSVLIHDSISVLTALEAYETGRKILQGKPLSGGEPSQAPLLLMHGDSDRICHAEGSRKLAELEGDRCLYREWPGLLHEIHNGGPGSDGSEVMDFAVRWIRREADRARRTASAGW